MSSISLKAAVGLLNASIVLVLLFAISTRPVTARTSEVLKVQLQHGGVLVGRHLTSHSGRHVRGFLGVPYAEPPVGELRFKSPVPFGSWKGERLALEDAPICMQRDPFRRDMEIEGSEDCLYLNVYVPEHPREKGPLTTMVWFHGGGWQCGAGISKFYGPEFFMDHDVVLVSANFRLGPLGFLSSETIDCPGNFGLKDQVEVLKWVQKNIGQFGGNPQQVTIFGESAGGASVTYHMLSEQTKGLFHKGIIQSGTYFNPWAQPAHKGVPAKRARKVAQLVNCNVEHSWQETLSCLRKKDAQDIVATLYDMFQWDFDPMIPFPPVVEPQHKQAFLSVLPRDAASKPHALSLPIMIGATSEEGLLKTAPLLNMPEILADFKQNFDTVLPIVLNYDHHSATLQARITQSIKDFYFQQGHNYNKQNHHNLTNLLSDAWFLSGIDEYLRMRLNSKQQIGNTYVYIFEHKGAASFTELFKGGHEDYYGTCHAEELQYLFPVGQALFVNSSPTKEDVKLREALLAMWVNFAKIGNPTPPDAKLPKWLPTTTYPVSFARLGSKDEQNWSLLRNDQNMYTDRLRFWQELPQLTATHQKQEKEEL